MSLKMHLVAMPKSNWFTANSHFSEHLNCILTFYLTCSSINMTSCLPIYGDILKKENIISDSLNPPAANFILVRINKQYTALSCNHWSIPIITKHLYPSWFVFFKQMYICILEIINPSSGGAKGADQLHCIRTAACSCLPNTYGTNFVESH